MKKLLIGIILLLALVVPASATDYFYLLEGDRRVVKNTVYDGNITIVVIDCKNDNDIIGCIIVANMELEKKKLAIAKKLASKK